MAGKRKAKPKEPAVAPAEVLAPFEARRRRAELVAASLGLTLLAATGALCAALQHPAPLFVLAAATVVVGLPVLARVLAGARLEGARALLEAGHFEPAVVALKRLLGGAAGDEARYLVALAYDRQGAGRLALESYRAYLERRRRGAWVVEARVRLEELEAAQAARDAVHALPALASAPRCPYCKDALGDTGPTVTCDSCGTQAHVGCWSEQGGCAVYGCAAGGPRERAGPLREAS